MKSPIFKIHSEAFIFATMNNIFHKSEWVTMRKTNRLKSFDIAPQFT